MKLFQKYLCVCDFPHSELQMGQKHLPQTLGACILAMQAMHTSSSPGWDEDGPTAEGDSVKMALPAAMSRMATRCLRSRKIAVIKY